jgi:hypothetical protein
VAYPGDGDSERKTQAEVLLNAYSRELERRRVAASAQGLLLNTEGKNSEKLVSAALSIRTDDDHFDEDDDDDDDEEFHYPGSSPQAMHASVRSFATDYFYRPFSRQPPPRTPTDLTPHLSQAPEFRVPTHEAPQKVVAPKYTPPTPHEMHARWERDHHVANCRDCQRRFSFLLRRVRPSHVIFIMRLMVTLSH